MNNTTKPSFFFCFGPPKSGTTFLQRTLNLHPEVSCPSEHQFDVLRQGLEQLCTRYNQTLLIVDRRTGGQGATIIDRPTLGQIFRQTVEALLRQAAGNKPLAGANDNAILHNLAWYEALFESPRLLAIFRNPIDTAISAWHHNLRLGEEENSSHRDYVLQYGGFSGWLRQSARWFEKGVMDYQSFAENHSNTLWIRYEDLVTNKLEILRQIFDFLGVSIETSTLEYIGQQSSLPQMRAQSHQPGFFRSGAMDMGQTVVSATLRQEIATITQRSCRYLGYYLNNPTMTPICSHHSNP